MKKLNKSINTIVSIEESMSQLELGIKELSDGIEEMMYFNKQQIVINEEMTKLVDKMLDRSGMSETEKRINRSIAIMEQLLKDKGDE